MTRKTGAGLLLALLLMLAGGHAKAVTVEAVTLPGQKGTVSYPQVMGLADAALQDTINREIIARADIQSYLNSLLALRADSTFGLEVGYTYTLTDTFVSLTVQAVGRMPNGRWGQAYHAMNVDLTTGAFLTLEDVFPDAGALCAFIESYMAEKIEPELSNYLDGGGLYPLPRDNFALSHEGVTFYYPAGQFAFLSGYSGAVSLHYDEIAAYLGDTPALEALGAQAGLSIAPDAAQAIAAACGSGALPGIPVRIGDNLQAVADQYRLLHDPDVFALGRYVQVEEAAMRDVWVLCDSATEEMDVPVTGLMTTRVNLYGIITGLTERAAWRAALGEPQRTAVLDASQAEGYRLPAGQSDYYEFGDYLLCLHADASGILHSVRLSR